MRDRCIKVLICTVAVMALTGCGSDGSANARNTGDQGSVQAVLEQGMEEADDTKADTEEPGTDNAQSVSRPEPEEVPAAESVSADGVDVDLTALSATMVYSEVYHMMIEPDSYVGKTVKMNGMYIRYHDDNTGKDYHACIISDATACCSQGIEFELTDDYAYPDDYPEECEDVCVVGTFATYQEQGSLYCTLKNARIEG